MEKFPFHKYTFLVITVERPKGLRTLLEQNDYTYVRDHGHYGDEMYIHKSIPNYSEIMKRHAKAKPAWVTLKCPFPRKECVDRGDASLSNQSSNNPGQ